MQHGVDVRAGRRGERQATVDQDRGADPAGVARRGQCGDEGPHRVAQQDDALGTGGVGDRHQVVDVRAEAPRPLQFPAAGAAPEVGSEEPHRRRARPPGHLVRDRLPGQGVGGDAVRRENQGGRAALAPGARRAGQVVHLQVAPGTLDPERCRHLARAHLETSQR